MLRNYRTYSLYHCIKRSATLHESYNGIRSTKWRLRMQGGQEEWDQSSQIATCWCSEWSILNICIRHKWRYGDHLPTPGMGNVWQPKKRRASDNGCQESSGKYITDSLELTLNAIWPSKPGYGHLIFTDICNAGRDMMQNSIFGNGGAFCPSLNFFAQFWQSTALL